MLTIGDLEAADVQGRATAAQEAAGAKDPRRLNKAWRKGQGVALRWLREAAGLSLEEVRVITGAGSRQAVHSWERGLSSTPLEALHALASHYGLPIGRFVVVGLPTVGETRDPVAASDPWATGTFHGSASMDASAVAPPVGQTHAPAINLADGRGAQETLVQTQRGPTTSPPAPGANSTSGAVSVVESNGAPGRTEATRGDDGEPARDGDGGQHTVPGQAIPEVP